jgi:hypothetical protein
MGAGMSGSIDGSHYGAGPYGRGRYSSSSYRNTGEALQGARSKVSLSASITTGTAHSILAGGLVQISGTIMWAKIQIPPCAPWAFLAQAACYRALPNSAGNMFPAAPNLGYGRGGFGALAYGTPPRVAPTSARASP